MKVRSLLFFMICTAVFLLGGCVSTPLAGVRQNGEIGIGALLPLSGKNIVYGERMLEGLRYAENELNSRRGIGGNRVKLMIFDTAGTAAGVEKAYQAAVESGVSGIIAGYSSAEAEAAAPLAKRYFIPTVFPLATANDITGKDNPFAVRSAYTDRQQGEALAAYLWYWRQLVRISVLIDNDSASGYERSTARSTARAFEDLGGVVNNMPDYQGGQFEKAINDALVSGPQAIVVSARGERAAAILEMIRAKGYSGLICGLDSWDDDNFFRALDHVEKLGECIFVSFFSPEIRSIEYSEFAEGFRRKNFHVPGSCETMSYDAFKMLAVGLENASTLEQFTANWLSIKNYFGAAAVYSALPGGAIDRTIYINAVEPPAGGKGCRSRLIRSFMHSKLATYRN